MKALSLTQPWATLVAIGAKRIETRSWQTKYRGPLAIHAAKGWPVRNEMLCRAEPFRSAFLSRGEVAYAQGATFPKGYIIAVVELVDCVSIPCRRWGMVDDTHAGVLFDVPPLEPELSFGDYTPGRYAWVLRNPRLLATPIPCKGRLGLFEVNHESLLV